MASLTASVDMRRRLQEGEGQPGEARAEGYRLRDIDAAPQPTARDQRHARQRGRHTGDALRRRDAPIDEVCGDPRGHRIARAMHLDLAPRGAARPGHVDCRHARIRQLPGDGGGDPPAHLLGDHRHADGAADGLDFGEQAAPIVVALGLQRLLHGVEVENERVRLDHRDGAAAFVHAVAMVQLHRPDVRQQQDIRRDGAHAERVRQSRLLYRAALRADAEARGPPAAPPPQVAG